MTNREYDHGYGSTWHDVLVYRREGYTTSVANYHEHDYYELNLVLSGNVRVLLPEHSVETDRSHLILTAPGTPHYIACHPDRLYSRLYLSFSADFVEFSIPEWDRLKQLFGRNGTVIAVTDSQRELCRDLMERIHLEQDALRKKLLILYLLSHVAEFAGDNRVDPEPTPRFIIRALAYIQTHYGEKIVASDLASILHIGRTTLMTAFKKHTGSTLGDYLTGVRLKQAERFFRAGRNVQEVAELCGFADSGALIRSFKRAHGVTPGKFLHDERPGEEKRERTL